MFSGSPDRWDIEWINAERIKAVAAFGLNERQRFLAEDWGGVDVVEGVPCAITLLKAPKSAALP